MKTVLRIAGIVCTLLFLGFAFSKVHWRTFLDSLAALRYPWVGAAGLALMASMYLRSLRWFIVTGLPLAARHRVWCAACAGYLGIIYPARVGEVLRMIKLKQLTGMAGGLAIGSAIADRILDGLGLGVLLALLILYGQRAAVVPTALVVIVWMFVAAGVMMMIFIASGNGLQGLFARVARMGRVGGKLHVWYQESLAGLQALRSPSRILLAFACQAAVCLCDIAVCWALFKAFGWQPPFMANIAMLVYLTAALTLPSTPGFVGIYQTAAIFALAPFAIGNSEAAAYGTVLQVLTLVLFISSGVWALRGQAPRTLLADQPR
ncbi:flippase-like domain-containing protein [Herbaspirillum sp. RU 5E]|uniref:lysylphosphatidylglycerol synthase transmembrane domain-containing protein n=1 Tax=Herbaspirillum sp. CAH-3 TaxID=2605746 RepID=UPI0012AC8E50|nr:lysylphosphatidylglycerol synthase transmembrane domain-containing protein [Herbaspirillum sp. CAH-3]MBW9333442.1 flippase-like domain-containing protein [Herbaspirillum sp. RU 5E]MRT28559.1 flippase-like domain-containing protein [Herbaspirillum sp. CAH-3]